MKFDFALILTLVTLVCGLFWFLERFVLAKVRAAREPDAGPNDIVDFFASLFPVLAIVLVLRSFIYEPFRIPSSSMMPTLLIGDFILVNKFAYGIRLPVLNTKVIETGAPERGDVVVFRYPGRKPAFPSDPPIGTDYIKRVVGLPGDVIRVVSNRVSVNGVPVVYTGGEVYVGRGPASAVEMTGSKRYMEALIPGQAHGILDEAQFPSPSGDGEYAVPAGHYFMMGDNRDASDDGRFWGFVPEENLAGRADAIWLNCSNWACVDSFDWRRMGTGIH